MLPPAVAGIGLLAALGPQGCSAARSASRLVLTTAGGGRRARRSSPRRSTCARRRRRSRRSTARGSTRRARSARARRARSRASRSRPRCPGLLAGARARLGPRAGRVRRDADVRRAPSAGVTQTVPLAIYERFATDFTGALALSAVLVGVSAALLLAVKLLSGAGARRCCALRRARGSGRSTSTSRSRSPPGRCLALAGPVGRGQDARAARRRRAAAARARARVAAARRCGSTPRAAIDLAPERRALRLRLPGLRAVRAPERVAERRLRADAGCRARARRERAQELLERFGIGALGRRAPAHAVRRRAPARRAGAGARARPARAAARRAAVGARRRARARAAGRELARRAARRRRARRCSSRTTSPRRRCSATRSRCVDGGRVVQRGDGGAARRRAGVGVRGRLHRRGRADRRRAPGAPAALTQVELDGGGDRDSADRATGPVGGQRLPVGDRARARARADPGSAQNHLAGRGRLDHRGRQPRAGRPRRAAAAHRRGPRRRGARARAAARARAPWRRGRRRRRGCCR